MKMCLFAALTALCTSQALAAPAQTLNLVDGDTFKLNGETVRIYSIDTPETWQPRCEKELVLGLEAKQRLKELLVGEIHLVRHDKDRFGRTLADVFASKVNVGETLIKEGLALPYQRGQDAKLSRIHTWCGPDASFQPWDGRQSENASAPAQLAQAEETKAESNDQSVYYPNCAAARAAGAAPIHFGDPGYRRKLDRDGDGIACE